MVLYFTLVRLLSVLLIILKVVLINIIIEPHIIPNYQNASAYSNFNPGAYQKPYSFSGNDSVTSLMDGSVIFLVIF